MPEWCRLSCLGLRGAMYLDFSTVEVVLRLDTNADHADCPRNIATTLSAKYQAPGFI